MPSTRRPGARSSRCAVPSTAQYSAVVVEDSVGARGQKKRKPSCDERAPVFDTMEQAQTITGLIMEHYNRIARSLLEGRGYEPHFAVDTRNNTVLWEMWD